MVSVIPVNDARRHRKHNCWCEPAVEWIDPNTGLPYANGPLVIHNSADGREHREEHGEVTGKYWQILENCGEVIMGWASGSGLAEDVWNIVRRAIPEDSERRKVARAIIKLFQDCDCDTIDEAERLCNDAGRERDWDTGKIVYRD